MKLHISKEWVMKQLDEPGGLMTCSPELWGKLLKAAPQQVVDVSEPDVE
jgi:hypothetical protein